MPTGARKSVTPRLLKRAPPSSVTAMTKASWVWVAKSWVVKSACIRLRPEMCLSHQYFAVFLVSGRAMPRNCSPDEAKRNPGRRERFNPLRAACSLAARQMAFAGRGDHIGHKVANTRDVISIPRCAEAHDDQPLGRHDDDILPKSAAGIESVARHAERGAVSRTLAVAAIGPEAGADADPAVRRQRRRNTKPTLRGGCACRRRRRH